MGGKPRPFHFGIGFIGNAIDRLGVAADEMEAYINRNPIRAIPVLMWEAHSWWYESQEPPRKPELTRDEFYELIEETGGIGSPTVLEFTEAMNRARTRHVPKGKPKPEKA